jgi:hypothetical protein
VEIRVYTESITTAAATTAAQPAAARTAAQAPKAVTVPKTAQEGR